jgi:hypothetical protein
MALAGSADVAVTEASRSQIPVVGQAVLGFILPWILAMVAVPLEMFLDSGRHVVAALVAAVLGGFGNLSRVLAHLIRSIGQLMPNLYDVYISIPLRIEGWIRGREGSPVLVAQTRSATRVEAGVGSGGAA